MKSKTQNKILSNFGLKLLSIIFAFLLWLLVMNISDSVITIELKDIPVQQLNGDALEELDKVYDVAKGDTVDIIVKGPRSVVEGLGEKDFIVSADLSTMSITNTVQISVLAKNVNIRDEISVTCVDNIMRLNLEEKVSNQYSVKVKTYGTVSDGFAVCGQQASPNIITVEGPESAVERITEVAVKVDVANLRGSTDTEGNIVLYDAYGDVIINDKITLSQDTAKVHLEVYPTREVPVVVDIKGTPKEGYIMSEVLYQPQTILISGTPEETEKVESININDVTISGLDADLETTVNLRDYLPDDIYIADVSDELVITVTLEEVVSKKLALTADDISLLQRTADREYLLELSEDFAIIVKGRSSQVSEITVDKLAPKLQCKDLSLGIHSNVEIEVVEIEGVTYEIVGSATLTIVSK